MTLLRSSPADWLWLLAWLLLLVLCVGAMITPPPEPPAAAPPSPPWPPTLIRPPPWPPALPPAAPPPLVSMSPTWVVWPLPVLVATSPPAWVFTSWLLSCRWLFLPPAWTLEPCPA